jgi:hypothetical protein
MGDFMAQTTTKTILLIDDDEMSRWLVQYLRVKN